MYQGEQYKLHPDIVNPYAHLYKKYQPFNIERDALPYIQAAIAQKKATAALQAQGQEYRVSDERVDKLHDLLLQGYHDYGETDDEAFETQFWAELEPLVRTHDAVIDFIINNRAYHSRCYGRWIIDILKYRDYAKGMMVVTGAGYDWLGRPCIIEEDDNFSEGISCDWTLVEARWRQMKTRSALMDTHRAAIIGAGYLPELSSKYGGTLPRQRLTILACDMDQRIPVEELEKQHPGLTYIRSDGLSLLRSLSPGSLGVISFPGVMSYNIDDFDDYMAVAVSRLRPGGTLLFDLQLEHPGMMYIGLMLDWSAGSAKPIRLLKRDDAIALVEQAAERHGVDWAWSHSGRYEQPATILFEFHKPT